LSRIISTETVSCPECGAVLIVHIWSCGCQRVSGQHNKLERYSFVHGRGFFPCECRPFVEDCGEPGENIWGHDDHEDAIVEEPRERRVIVEEPVPELIRIKRIDAQKLAMERYARGLITKEQYNEIMANL